MQNDGRVTAEAAADFMMTSVEITYTVVQDRYRRVSCISTKGLPGRWSRNYVRDTAEMDTTMATVQQTGRCRILGDVAQS